MKLGLFGDGAGESECDDSVSSSADVVGASSRGGLPRGGGFFEGNFFVLPPAADFFVLLSTGRCFCGVRRPAVGLDAAAVGIVR